MRAAGAFLLFLSCLGLPACGAAADSELLQSTYASFRAAGAAGDFETWAGHLDPGIREVTVAPMVWWLREKAPGTAVEEGAAGLLAEYGFSNPETVADALSGRWNRQSFLGRAIPLVLEGMGEEERRGLSESLVPPPGPVEDLQITGDSAHGVARQGAREERIVFRRHEGAWKLVSF